MSAAVVYPLFSARPAYEFRLAASERGEYEYSIWRMPSHAAPTLTAPERISCLHGEAARVIENRMLRLLARARIKPGPIRLGEKRSWSIDEDSALTLGLLLRALAPLRKIDRIREIAERIEEMSREEAVTGSECLCTGTSHGASWPRCGCFSPLAKTPKGNKVND